MHELKKKKQVVLASHKYHEKHAKLRTFGDNERIILYKLQLKL